MKRLIVNGDDFGFTTGVNEGILRAHHSGVLKSATIMANGDAFDDAVAKAKADPELGVGIHLCLVGGKSISRSSSLAPGGVLPATLTILGRRLLMRQIYPEDIANELGAQIAKVKDAGIEPTHVDSHKHTHLLPRVFDIIATVAGEMKIRKVRIPFEYANGILREKHYNLRFLRQSLTAKALRSMENRWLTISQKHHLLHPDFFVGFSETGFLDRKSLEMILTNLREGTTELMCHPGIHDSQLESARTRLKRQRQIEFEALTDPSLPGLLQRQGIQSISYREI